MSKEVPVGEVFGILQVVREDPNRLPAHHYKYRPPQEFRMVVVICTLCGFSRSVRLSNLKNGNTSGCHCVKGSEPPQAPKRRKFPIPWYIEDGLRAGLLTVEQASKISGLSLSRLAKLERPKK